MYKFFPVLLFLGLFAYAGMADDADSNPPPQNMAGDADSRPPPKRKAAKSKPPQADESDNSKSSHKNKPSELCKKKIEYSSVRPFLELFDISKEAFEGAPADVKCFAAHAVACERFAGEEPYEKERAAFLNEALTRHCSAARNQLKPLKKKYQSKKEALQILAICEPGSQAVCAF